MRSAQNAGRLSSHEPPVVFVSQGADGNGLGRQVPVGEHVNTRYENVAARSCPAQALADCSTGSPSGFTHGVGSSGLQAEPSLHQM